MLESSSKSHGVWSQARWLWRVRAIEWWPGAVQIAKAYEEGGAACISVLTDSKYFQGDFSYLRDIRASGVTCPLLCKEFVVEAYQMFAARAAGADAILLIAAVLPNSDLAYLLKSAAKVNLQALVEVHTVAGEQLGPPLWLLRWG